MAKSILRMDHKFEDLVSVKFWDGSKYEAIENGRVLKLDGLISGEREVFKGIAPTATANDIVIVAGVELNADESSRKKANLDEFENKAGVAFRAINPKNSVGKIFSVSDNALTKAASAVPAVGDDVTLDATTPVIKLTASVAGTITPANHAFIGKIIAKETVAGTVMSVIQIIKA